MSQEQNSYGPFFFPLEERRRSTWNILPTKNVLIYQRDGRATEQSLEHSTLIFQSRNAIKFNKGKFLSLLALSHGTITWFLINCGDKEIF